VQEFQIGGISGVAIYHATALESAGGADGAYLSWFPVSIDGDA
jgi:hypothetical protein